MRSATILVAAAVAVIASGLAATAGERGKASYYADFFEGRRTASGAVFRQDRMTAAHRDLPFGTRVMVTRTSGGRSVAVCITDRGPFVGGRIIDLSKAAARRLGMIRSGVVSVEVTVIGKC